MGLKAAYAHLWGQTQVWTGPEATWAQVLGHTHGWTGAGWEAQVLGQTQGWTGAAAIWAQTWGHTQGPCIDLTGVETGLAWLRAAIRIILIISVLLY